MGTLRLVTFLAALFVSLPGVALAQPQIATPAWDAALTAGSFHARSSVGTDAPYGDNWYHAGELRLAVGRYWTSHLKTELEVGATSEDWRYTQGVATLPGSNTRYPYSVEDYFRMQQASARVVWQFLDNQWVHPYVFAGVSLDADRERTHIREQSLYNGNPSLPGTRLLIVPEQSEGPTTVYRPRLVLGGGLKWYVSPRAFVKTGVQAGFATPASTASFLIGMGFDF